MTCKFSSLKFGDVITLSGGSACCGICGYNTQPQVELAQWKYCGHSNDMDLFEQVGNICCPSCGCRMDGYGERCGEYGGLEITDFILNIPLVEGED